VSVIREPVAFGVLTRRNADEGLFPAPSSDSIDVPHAQRKELVLIGARILETGPVSRPENML